MIFIVVGSFKLGGTERTASRIGLELIRRGHAVKFILLKGVFDYNEKELVENSIVLDNPKWKFKTVRKMLSLFTLIALLKRHRPRYLVSFSMGINLFVFFTFYRRIIFRIESNIFIYKKKLYRRYFQKILSISPNVKKIVVPSKGLYDGCYQYFLAPEKLVLISNPIDIPSIQKLGAEPIADYPQLQNGKFIVTAGRLHESKGFGQLIQVFLKSKLAATYSLVILGEGPQRPALEKMIRDLSAEQSVYLLGYQQNPYRFFAKARFFILNSAHESFGNVLIESMAAGIPVVSNDCDFGPRHIIKQGQNGILYKRSNEAEFLSALESVGLDDALWESLKGGAKTEVEHYKIQEITSFWTLNIINFE
jgi:glycosyltransferase involved in cell wall biosynthesis